MTAAVADFRQLTIRHRVMAWRYARRAYIQSGRNQEKAIALVQQEIPVAMSAEFDPATIAMIIQLAILLIKLWIKWRERHPRPNPRHRDLFPEEAEPDDSLWGRPTRRTVRGAWGRGGYGGPGELDSRDFASVASNSTGASFVIAALCGMLEVVSQKAYPDLHGGIAFSLSFFSTTTIYVLAKTATAYLRSYGESWLRNFYAWLWEIVADWFRSIWPFGRQARQRRRDRRQDRRKERRRRWFPWLRRRRS